MKYIAYIFAFLFLLFPFFNTNAATTDNVFGYAWSGNTGWISFNNCENPEKSSTCASIDYGVSFDVSTDIVSGYAWSDNLGWISFNPTDWGVCPPNNSGCTLSNFKNYWKNGSSGWARALSAMDSNSGGWDGWISLNSTSFNSTDISSNIIAKNLSDFDSFGSKEVYGISTNSYAWGSEVVGWVDLNYMEYNPTKGGLFAIEEVVGSINLSVNDNNIDAGETVNFTWTATDFTPNECSGSSNGNAFDDWVKNFSGGTSGSMNNINVKYDPNNQVSISTDFILECTDNSITRSDTVTVTANPVVGSINLSVNDNNIVAAETVNFTWTATDFVPDECSGSSTSGNAFGDWVKNFPGGTSGSMNNINVKYDPNNLSGVSTDFILECTDTVNSITRSDTVTVTANPLSLSLTHTYNPCYQSTWTFDPELIWTKNTSIVKNCVLNSNQGYSNIPVSSSPITDTNFTDDTTAYQLVCETNDSTYQTPATAGAYTTINYCTADYSITSSDSCSETSITGIGDNLEEQGSDYVASIDLGISPTYGFNQNVTLSGSPSIGSMTLTPSNGVFSGGSGTVNVGLIFNQDQYDILKMPHTGDSLMELNLTATSSGYADKNITIKVCDLDGGQDNDIKPKYKPF
ncbi:MAG: hypothetical protein U9R00_01310 [Patescibacteria group bacterium]|nr:hypothetical protein [Patescibacteria group bacterium]